MNHIIFSAAIAAALGVAVLPADAGSLNRVWVSGHGTDQAGCGAPVSPCRSLQYAHDSAAAAGGEIDIMDPAGYGAVTISKAISVVNHGGVTAGIQSTTTNPAVTINAGPTDAVYLQGLTIDGLSSASNGVVFNSGGSLTLVDSVVKRFTQNGVSLGPSSTTATILLSNVLVSDNLNGVAFATGASGQPLVATVEHVTAVNNHTGLSVIGGTTGSLSVSAEDSTLNNNSVGAFVDTNTAPTALTLDFSHLDNNGTGLRAADVAIVHVSRSVLNQNATGIDNQTSNTGAIQSTGDNRVDGNTAPLNGAALVSDPLM